MSIPARYDTIGRPTLQRAALALRSGKIELADQLVRAAMASGAAVPSDIGSHFAPDEIAALRRWARARRPR